MGEDYITDSLWKVKFAISINLGTIRIMHVVLSGFEMRSVACLAAWVTRNPF